MLKLATTYLNPKNLIPNGWNPNEVDPINQEKLKKSIEVDGFFKPVLVRDANGGTEIIGGFHRIKAAIDIGMTEVPCVNLGPISEEQAKKIGLKDNYRYGEDDMEKLTELLNSGFIDAIDFTSEMPVDDAELAGFFEHTSLEDIDIDLELSEDDDGINLVSSSTEQTHEIMRFKVSLDDAENINELIAKTKHQYGYTESDNLTNAGDALIHLLKAISE